MISGYCFKFTQPVEQLFSAYLTSRGYGDGFKGLSQKPFDLMEIILLFQVNE